MVPFLSSFPEFLQLLFFFQLMYFLQVCPVFYLLLHWKTASIQLHDIKLVCET